MEEKKEANKVNNEKIKEMREAEERKRIKERRNAEESNKRGKRKKYPTMKERDGGEGGRKGGMGESRR